MITMKQQHKQQSGFTILELMIATVVVSVILLLVTTVMISLQDLYYKGVNQETVQNNVRNITNTVSQEIQDATANDGTTVTSPPITLPFSIKVNTVTHSVEAICIGSARYMYIVGLPVGSGKNQVNEALWRDSYPPGNCQDVYNADGTLDNALNIITGTPPDGGVAYIAPGTRLTDFEVNPPVFPDTNYSIRVSVAIGSDALLTANTGFNDRCITATGDQFCATASLLTEVGQRVQ